MSEDGKTGPGKDPHTVEGFMDDKEFLKAFVNQIMTAYVLHGDDCFACESDLWNSYPFTMMEEFVTLHAMRPGGEVEPNDCPEENFKEMIRTARDWRDAERSKEGGTADDPRDHMEDE